MKIRSGTTDQYIPFYAVDADGAALTGLSSFTVYRSRNGATPVAMTTPTIVEASSSNMPGLYWLLMDEDMTIGAGNATEIMTFYVTHAGMAPVPLAVELYSDALLLAGVNSEVDTALSDYDPPTKAEMEARTLASADYATATALATVDNVADAIKAVTDNLPDSGALSSLATASALATVDGVVDAIKVVTDKLDDTLEDDSGTYRFTANALEEAPSGGGGSGPSASDIADAVLDEALAGHTTAGTLGKAIADILEDTGTTIPGLIGALNDVSAADVNAACDQAIADAGLATDDDVTAIKAVTDQFVFTKEGEVDANIKSINSAEVTGNGDDQPWDAA